MAAGALTGGAIGGKIAHSIDTVLLKWVVAVIGTITAIVLSLRLSL